MRHRSEEKQNIAGYPSPRSSREEKLHTRMVQSSNKLAELKASVADRQGKLLFDRF